jgi:hypothetical protein
MASMKQRPKIRVVIDRLVLSEQSASSETHARQALGQGIAQALAQRALFIRGNHAVVRVASGPGTLSAQAAGAALGEVLAASAPGRGAVRNSVPNSAAATESAVTESAVTESAAPGVKGGGAP